MNTESEVVSTVAVLAFEDDKVLLVRHGEAASHITDTYGLPSGRLEDGETEKQAAIREFKEETGLQTTPEDLIDYPANVYIATLDRKRGTRVTFSWHVFIAKSFSGNLQETDETKPEWIKISEMDKLNLLPNIQRATIEGLRFLQMSP